MTEQEWMACTVPTQMLGYLRLRDYLRPTAPGRKSRLFAVACCRRLENILTERAKEALLAAERFADGSIDRHHLHAAWVAVGFPKREDRRMAATAARAASCSPGYDGTAHACTCAVNAASERNGPTELEATRRAEWAAQCSLLLCIFGNPFHPPFPLHEGVLAWNDATVRRIAEGIYEERAFDLLPILADALIDAGCEQEELIGHCRSEGPHVRGCWGVDLILGRS